MYDTQWEGIKYRQSTQQEANKRQAEAAEAERKRAAEEASYKQKEEEALQGRLRHLQQLRFEYDSRIFEINRVIRKLTADLNRLQDLDNEMLKKEREKNSWLTYLTIPLYGKVKETEQEKKQREMDRLSRIASKSIKGNELKQNKASLQSLESALQGVDDRIAAEKRKSEEEAQARAKKRHEQLMREYEAKRRLEKEQERERQAKREAAEAAEAQRRREETARAAKEACDAQNARAEAQKREREARAAAEKRERDARMAQERARTARAAREAEVARAQREARSKPATAPSSSRRASTANNKKSTCQHSAFWPQLPGSHECSNCHTIQRRFAFQCPGCRIVACAGCRRILRGGKTKKGHRSSEQYGYDHDDSPDARGGYESYYDWD